MTRSETADGTLVLWLGATTHLVDSQGLGMAVLYWSLIGAHGRARITVENEGTFASRGSDLHAS